MLTDREKCPVVDIGLELALAMARLYPEQFKLDPMSRLLGDDATLAALKAGTSRAAIKATWAKDLAAFQERRQAYLIYPANAAR